MQSEANLEQLSSKENGLASLDINGTTEKNILESQRAVTGKLHHVLYGFACVSPQAFSCKLLKKCLLPDS